MMFNARINSLQLAISALRTGLQIPLLLDLRIVTDDVEFGMTELNVGSAAIMGSAFPLPLLAETICTD